MQLSPQDILSMLNYLNIKHKSYPNSRNWLDIVCPFHDDKDFGNAGINLNSGAINCYRCGQKGHILQEIKRFANIQDYKQLLNFLQLNFYINTSSSNCISFYKKEIKEKKNIKNFDVVNKEYIKYNVKDIDTSSSKYMQDRRFTEEFCKEFNIKQVVSGFYRDYFALPIIDSKKDIVTIEFRKLFQYEYYQKFYKKQIINEKDIKDFKQYCKNENIYINSQGQLLKNNQEYYNSTIEYLLNKKVRYEVGSKIDETIWNIGNLDFDEDLYVCEGVGSLPKLYQNVSQNVTCTFGSNVSDYQVEYLKKFKKRIILIPDNDDAGKKMIIRLFTELKNFYLILTTFEDTDEEYVEDILHTSPIQANNYVAKQIANELF